MLPGDCFSKLPELDDRSSLTVAHKHRSNLFATVLPTHIFKTRPVTKHLNAHYFDTDLSLFGGRECVGSRQAKLEIKRDEEGEVANRVYDGCKLGGE